MKEEEKKVILVDDINVVKTKNYNWKTYLSSDFVAKKKKKRKKWINKSKTLGIFTVFSKIMKEEKAKIYMKPPFPYT